MLRPVRSESLGQLAFEKLEQYILSGNIEPGQNLNEAALARTLMISRGPLREAIGRLEGRGLVTRMVNRQPRVTSLTNKQLLELFIYREAIEGMAARQAAVNIKEAELKRLKRLLDSHENDSEFSKGSGYFQGPGNTDFHLYIAFVSRNERLREALAGPIYAILRLYRRRLSQLPGRSQEALTEHRAIVQAIEDRNPVLAEQIMREHISAGSKNINLYFKEKKLKISANL